MACPASRESGCVSCLCSRGRILSIDSLWFLSDELFGLGCGRALSSRLGALQLDVFFILRHFIFSLFLYINLFFFCTIIKRHQKLTSCQFPGRVQLSKTLIESEGGREIGCFDCIDGLRGLVASTVHCHHAAQARIVGKLQFVERCDICPVEVNKQTKAADGKKKQLKRPPRPRRPAANGLELKLQLQLQLKLKLGLVPF